MAGHWLSLAAASGATLCSGPRASPYSGFSCFRAQALGTQALVIVLHGLSCSKVCGIFLDQGLNLCPLLWEADSYPMDHQGSPAIVLFNPLFNLRL